MERESNYGNSFLKKIKLNVLVLSETKLIGERGVEEKVRLSEK